MNDNTDNTAAADLDPRHGGAFDRGAADAYYGRPPTPHMFKGNTYSSGRLGASEMTAAQVAGYLSGYHRG